ncbi:T-lymphocyte surface antigen Ly-9 isoform X1 [Sus scrofa]|uniref:Ig-like domain-containing protein n=3 Tax=Sus scrofa TaxID=9823 RepID=A0A8D1U994_PIG|nr:T-lymphocyte surface antigen Ly-9 isoform X1 [Sus scrofa]XP_020945222.1 T-lymphocyte surface antigen Ly-9 isoform X1 [Sus scrofa]
MGHSLLWFSLLLGLLTGPGVSRVDSAPVVVTGTLGGSVTLPLMLPVGQHVESIFWMCRSVPGTIATVTLEEAGGPDIFYQAETRYWDRLSVVGPGRSLQISHLSWEDAGPYQAHINLRNSHIPHTWEYSLNVYEQLARPRVTMSSRISGNGHCLVILTCVAESRGGTVTYSWTPLGPRTVVSHGGSVLSVSLRPGDGALNFTCMVKNPVSNSSSLPVLVPPSCTGPGILGEDTMGEIVIGTLGKSATLPLEVPVGQEVEKVTWSSRGLVATLQPGRAGKPILVDGTQGPYSRRLSVPQHGYSLQISPLRLQDSGPFRAWITLHNPPINITKDFTLRVYEHLQEPSITASSQIMEDGTCLVTLACSLDQAGEDVQYSWDPRGRRTVVSHGGSTLNISWRSGVSDSYRCTVENPISQSSGSIPIRPLCSASYLPRSWRKEFLLFLVLVALQIEHI